jgi:hypothetical protein
LIAQLTKESRHVLDGPGNRSDHLPLLQHALLRIWDVAAARWKREAEQPGGAVDLLIGPADFKAACGTESLTLDGCLNFHANAALKSAQAAARSHLGNGPDADQRAERMLLVALCTIARRDDRNNWARRFTSAPRIAALIGDGCPDNEKAAREALETLRLSGYLNDIRRGSVGIHDLASEAPNTDAKLFDVSHEALIRRWRKLRDEVLPAAEELAESLNEVERNLSEITRLEAAGESCQTIVQPLPIWKFLGSPAGTIRKFWPHFAEAVRTMPSHVAGWWRHVSEISRTKGCGRPAVILRQLDDASVRFWAWINETPEKLATATVPDRVRGSLSSILGDNARFPRPLGAALLADMIERNQGLTGDDSRLAVEAKRRELEHRLLRRIEQMEAPWRTASRYSRRTVNRPMKFLTGALIFLLILMLAVVNITTHAEFTEEQRKNADFNASAAQVMALAANIGSVVEQGLAIEVAAFELQRALDKVIELEETLTSRSNDAIDRDPTAEVLITLDEKSRLDIGIPQFEHSSQALDQWIRSLIGRVTLRVLNEPPPPRGDQACVALNGSDGKPIPISRTVGGRPFGLSFDPRTSTWTTITPAKQGAGPVEAEVIDKQNAPLPAKGLVCLSTDASVAMTWETGGEGTNGGQMNDLPKFWALPWACKVSVNGSCQKWTVRVQDLRSPLLSDPDLFAPAMFNETFRAARDAVLEDRSGPEGIFLLKSTQDLPRTGFELAFGSPDKRLVADFGDGLAAPPIVDAPTNSEIVHTCVKRVPGRDCREACVGNVPARDCREVSLGPWRIRWAERPFDKPKTDPDGCPDASCQAFVTIYNQKGFRLGEVQLTSGRIDAFSVDGSALLIGDEHGIWRRIVVERPELRKHLDALNPSPSSGQTARQQLTPLCQTYNCKDWNKSLSATTQ